MHPEDVRSCPKTGDSLWTTCPSCGKDLRKSFKFCPACNCEVEREQTIRALLTTAEEAFALYRYDEALGNANKALELQPEREESQALQKQISDTIDRAQSLRKDAAAAWDRQAFEESIEIYKEFLTLVPEDTVAPKRIGEAPQKIRDRDIRNLLDEAKAFFVAGRVAEGVEKRSNALGLCENDERRTFILESTRQDEYKAHLVLVNRLMNEGRYKQALAESEATLTTFPDAPEALELKERVRRELVESTARRRMLIAIAVPVAIVLIAAIAFLIQWSRRPQAPSTQGAPAIVTEPTSVPEAPVTATESPSEQAAPSTFAPEASAPTESPSIPAAPASPAEPPPAPAPPATFTPTPSEPPAEPPSIPAAPATEAPPPVEMTPAP
jgi:tetratricopeptide (TPR) repeat protein